MKKWNVRRSVMMSVVCAAVGLASAGVPAHGAPNPVTKAPPPFSQVGLNAESSGPNYVPTGEIVADSGFRPSLNGFSFENYGNEGKPKNLTSVQMERLFGRQVCLSGTGATCVLTPAADRWKAQENSVMGGGHCMGFSVSALRFFAGTLRSRDFGADTVNELALTGNTKLQNNIAESFVYQSIPAIQRKMTYPSPREALRFLIRELEEGREFYTLGIFSPTGGHAITPLAVEARGKRQFVVLVYDNNYPSVTRALEIDARKNTFRYVGSSNPAEPEFVYSGNAKKNNLDLTPTLIGEKMQPCPFCDRKKANGNPGKGTVLPKSRTYSEMTLSGNQANHPHLVFTDTKGRQTGIIDGKVVDDIPGVNLSRRFADDETLGQPEPKFQIRPGTDVFVTIDGTGLRKPSKNNTIDYLNNGLVVSVDDVVVRPGQQDSLFFPGGGEGLVYTSDSNRLGSPLFYTGVEDGSAAYTFAATAAGLKKGSTLGLIVLKKQGQVLLDASDARGRFQGKAFYGLVINKMDSKGNDYTWVDDDLVLENEKQEDIYFNYKLQELRPNQPVEVEVGPEGGPFKVRRARYVK